jgi:hypothetical protein
MVDLFRVAEPTGEMACGLGWGRQLHKVCRLDRAEGRGARFFDRRADSLSRTLAIWARRI